jgi:hypothetical protein
MKIALINFYVQVFFLINVNFSHENIFNLLTLYNITHENDIRTQKTNTD